MTTTFRADHHNLQSYIDGLVQDCSNSNALAMELLQFFTKQLMLAMELFHLFAHDTIMCHWSCVTSIQVEWFASSWHQAITCTSVEFLWEKFAGRCLNAFLIQMYMTLVKKICLKIMFFNTGRLATNQYTCLKFPQVLLTIFHFDWHKAQIWVASKELIDNIRSNPSKYMTTVICLGHMRTLVPEAGI